MSPDWEQAEKRLPKVGWELWRLFRRARKRWWAAVLVSLGLAGLLVTYLSLQQPSFRARIVLLLTESTAATEEPAMPLQELRDYITDVVFAKPRLLELIEKHRLYPVLFVRDPLLAVATMRQDLQVDVARNYFLDYRGRHGAPRSARIFISYQAEDPDLAHEVALDLGRLLGEFEAGSRHETATALAKSAQLAVDDARNRLALREDALAELRAGARTMTSDPVAIARLEGQVTADALDLRDLERRAWETALWRDIEERRLGFKLEVVAAEAPVRSGGRGFLLVIGVLALVVLMPLCAMAVSAFDPRIHDLDDARRLGLTPLGYIRLDEET